MDRPGATLLNEVRNAALGFIAKSAISLIAPASPPYSTPLRVTANARESSERSFFDDARGSVVERAACLDVIALGLLKFHESSFDLTIECSPRVVGLKSNIAVRA